MEENKVWYIEEADYVIIPPEVNRYQHRYLGDTLINDIVYQNFDVGALLREDTSARKVWLQEDGYENGECLLYDFAAEAGDTLETCNFIIVIDSLGTTTLPSGEVT